MRYKTRWATLPPQTALALIFIVLAFFAFIPQLIAVIITAPNKAEGEQRLKVLEYIGLWGKADPTLVTGAVVPAIYHWAIVISPFLIAALILFLFLKGKSDNKKNPQLRAGLAKPRDVNKAIGEKALLRSGAKLRERLASKRMLTATDCGYRIGTYWGKEIWACVEDPMIVIGPSRSGKGFNIVLNWIINAPGAVITTSSKVDNLFLTMEARKQSSDGKSRDVWIFAPGIEGVEKLGHTLRWNPVEGCIDEATLLRRIKALVPSGAFGGSTSNGGHWDTLGQQLAAHLFHAAACAGGDVDLIWSWVSSPTRANEAVKFIREHPDGLQEHAAHLQEVINMPPEQRASSWGTLVTVLAFLESRTAREWLKTDTNPKQHWHPVKFVLRRETLYLIGGNKEAPAYKVIIEGLLTELDHESSNIARQQGGRLDPPVTYLIDEAANFTYPGLDQLITDGGGQGRIGVPIFQSKAQLSAYGDNAEQALWDAARVKIVLPGTSDPKTLEEINVLMGEIDVVRESHTHGEGPLSINMSEHKESAFIKNEIREMERTHCFVFYGNMKPIIAKMIPFSEQPKFKKYLRDAKHLQQKFNLESRYASLVEKYQDAKN